MFILSLRTLFSLALVVGVTAVWFPTESAKGNVPDECTDYIDDVTTCVRGNIKCWLGYVQFLHQLEIPYDADCKYLEEVSCDFFLMCVECEEYVDAFMGCVEAETVPQEKIITVCNNSTDTIGIDDGKNATTTIDCYNITMPASEALECDDFDIEKCFKSEKTPKTKKSSKH